MKPTNKIIISILEDDSKNNEDISDNRYFEDLDQVAQDIMIDLITSIIEADLD